MKIFKFISLSLIVIITLLIYFISTGEISIISNKYIINFLSPQWFILMFSIGFFVISYKIAKESGWQNLANKFVSNNYSEPNKKFYLTNGYIGNFRYSGVLKILANDDGLYLRVFFPFKFGHKNLFIPWNEISSISLEKSFFRNEYLNFKLYKFPNQRLEIKSFQELLDNIPENFKIIVY